MRRFWREVGIARQPGGWQVTLDGRGIRTQGGVPQLVPGEALAQLLAQEWRDAGEMVDPRGFPLRDLADFALDTVAADPAGTIAKLLAYADTDTLLYRADPEEPLYRRQLELWEPPIAACEARYGVAFQRVSGVMHRPQPPDTLAALKARLEAEEPLVLAGLLTLASLAASLIVALAVLDGDEDVEPLFAAAHAEADWQAQLWGEDAEAAQARAARLDAFRTAARFVRAARR